MRRMMSSHVMIILLCASQFQTERDKRRPLDMTCSDFNLAEDLKKPEDTEFKEIVLLKKIDDKSMRVRKTLDGKFKDPEFKAVYCPRKAQQMYRDAAVKSEARTEKKESGRAGCMASARWRLCERRRGLRRSLHEIGRCGHRARQKCAIDRRRQLLCRPPANRLWLCRLSHTRSKNDLLHSALILFVRPKQLRDADKPRPGAHSKSRRSPAGMPSRQGVCKGVRPGYRKTQREE